MTEQQTTQAETADEPYVPGDRTGYTVTEQKGRGVAGQVTYAITRDADGAGLGAYSQQPEIDEIIAEDRAYLAELTRPDTTEGAAPQGTPAAPAAGADGALAAPPAAARTPRPGE